MSTDFILLTAKHFPNPYASDKGEEHDIALKVSSIVRLDSSHYNTTRIYYTAGQEVGHLVVTQSIPEILELMKEAP